MGLAREASVGWAGLHGSGNVVGGWCLHWCHWTTCGVLGVRRVEALHGEYEY